MAVYRTCYNCALAKLPCVRRDSIQTDIAGLGITSLKFSCKERKPVFERGQRVTVSWPVPDGGEYGNDYTLEGWPATVIRESGARFLIVVDDVPSDHETPARDYVKNESLYARVPAGRLAPLAGEYRAICDACDQIPGDDGRYAGCYGYQDGVHSYRPQKCAQPLPSPTHPGRLA